MQIQIKRNLEIDLFGVWGSCEFLIDTRAQYSNQSKNVDLKSWFYRHEYREVGEPKYLVRLV